MHCNKNLGCPVVQLYNSSLLQASGPIQTRSLTQEHKKIFSHAVAQNRIGVTHNHVFLAIKAKSTNFRRFVSTESIDKRIWEKWFIHTKYFFCWSGAIRSRQYITLARKRNILCENSTMLREIANKRKIVLSLQAIIEEFATTEQTTCTDGF